MKVLMVNKLYYPHIGGVENHVRDLSLELKDIVDISVLAANTKFKTEKETIDGIEVVKVASLGRLRSAPVAPTFPLWLREIRTDIFHFHFPYPIGEISYLIAKPAGKLVVTYHSDIVRQKFLLWFYAPFLNRFLELADRIIVSSPNLINHSPFLRKFREKCAVIPFGIDLSRFELNDEIISKSNMFREKTGTPLILFMGRLIYYKGLEYLILAMKNIDAKLLIVGSGPLRNDLEEICEKNGLSEKVIFFGEASDDDIPSIYHASDIFVLPSIARSEAFGLVQLEAHACGKPVVSTNLTTGVPFVNLDKETGIVVPPASSVALSEAINFLLKNEDICRKYGENAKKRVEEQFSRRLMGEKVYNLYKEVLEA